MRKLWKIFKPIEMILSWQQEGSCPQGGFVPSCHVFTELPFGSSHLGYFFKNRNTPKNPKRILK